MQAGEPVPTTGNGAAKMGREVRQIYLMEKARDAIGSSAALGEVIGVGRRAVNHKLVADRPITPLEMRLVADELDRRSADMAAVAAGLRELAA